MSSKPPNRELERVIYWEGQMLRSSDFLDIQRVEDQRRWWHNRAMHRAYGVYQGFEAKSIGTSSVEVLPGVAYDCFGRELILECAATIQYALKPLAVGKERTLLVRHKKPESRRQTDAIAAVCCFCDGRSSSGNIEFVWIDAPKHSLGPKEGIPLGRLSAQGERVRGLVTPPRQRPLSRPHLATGSTVPGNTSWEPWDFSLPQYAVTGVPGPQPIEIGVQTTIDTSAAGFTDVTQYFAWLEGSIWNSQTLQLVPALLPSLANEALDSFTFRLILMKNPQNSAVFEEALSHTIAPKLQLIQDSGDFADFAQQQGLYVSWLGCQMPAHASFVPQNKIVCRTKFPTVYEQRIR